MRIMPAQLLWRVEGGLIFLGGLKKKGAVTG